MWKGDFEGRELGEQEPFAKDNIYSPLTPHLMVLLRIALLVFFYSCVNF